MPRYLVERTFKDGFSTAVTSEGVKYLSKTVMSYAEMGVTWLHSYVSKDRKKTYCVYDGPNEDAIRQVGQRHGLPCDCITEVSILDPYFYH